MSPGAAKILEKVSIFIGNLIESRLKYEAELADKTSAVLSFDMKRKFADIRDNSSSEELS